MDATLGTCSSDEGSTLSVVGTPGALDRQRDNFVEFVRSSWPGKPARGERFVELRDTLYQLFHDASVEQRVVIHSAFHLSGDSITLSLLFAYGHAGPKQFALAALACQQIIPDALDEEEWFAFQDRVSGHAGDLATYLSDSLSKTERLIRLGEGTQIEFKATFRRNLHTGKADKNIETASLKEIVGFMNTLGGSLIIGVNDDGKISGLNQDIFSNTDGYQTHFANQLRDRIGADAGRHLKYHFDLVGGKKVLRVECMPLPPNDLAFLDGDIYIRNASQTIRLNTKEAIEWRTKSLS